MKPYPKPKDPTECPRCGHGIPNDERRGEYPGAVSRRDNKTMICSKCGTEEALEDLFASRPRPVKP